jgi:hypothetical protein
VAIAEAHDALGLVHFLLVFDGPGQMLLRCDRFEDETEAISAFATAEGEYRGRGDVEVVLLGSDSLETIKRTHGQYFATASTPDLPSVTEF